MLVVLLSAASGWHSTVRDGTGPLVSLVPEHRSVHLLRGAVPREAAHRFAEVKERAGQRDAAEAVADGVAPVRWSKVPRGPHVSRGAADIAAATRAREEELYHNPSPARRRRGLPKLLLPSQGGEMQRSLAAGPPIELEPPPPLVAVPQHAASACCASIVPAALVAECPGPRCAHGYTQHTSAERMRRDEAESATLRVLDEPERADGGDRHSDAVAPPPLPTLPFWRGK